MNKMIKKQQQDQLLKIKMINKKKNELHYLKKQTKTDNHKNF